VDVRAEYLEEVGARMLREVGQVAEKSDFSDASFVQNASLLSPLSLPFLVD